MCILMGKLPAERFCSKAERKRHLDFMLAGEYEFNTDAEEIMEVLGGDMSVMLPGESEYTLYTKGQSYVVPANSSFKMIVEKYVDYCCSYKND